jgi:hypothetical protein
MPHPPRMTIFVPIRRVAHARAEVVEVAFVGQPVAAVSKQQSAANRRSAAAESGRCGTVEAAHLMVEAIADGRFVVPPQTQV